MLIINTDKVNGKNNLSKREKIRSEVLRESKKEVHLHHNNSNKAVVLNQSKMFTTQKQIRESFWESFPQYASERRARKTQNDYKCDIRMTFCDYVESLRRDGQISEKLAYNVTL